MKKLLKINNKVASKINEELINSFNGVNIMPGADAIVQKGYVIFTNTVVSRTLIIKIIKDIFELDLKTAKTICDMEYGTGVVPEDTRIFTVVDNDTLEVIYGSYETYEEAQLNYDKVYDASKPYIEIREIQ